MNKLNPKVIYETDLLVEELFNKMYYNILKRLELEKELDEIMEYSRKYGETEPIFEFIEKVLRLAEPGFATEIYVNDKLRELRNM